MRVCVIGAGPSGLTTLRALQSNLDEHTYEVVCYERYDSIGGIWNFMLVILAKLISYCTNHGLQSRGTCRYKHTQHMDEKTP